MINARRVFAPLGPLAALLVALLVALAACQTAGRGLAPFDAAATQRTAELKVATHALMAKSGERYSKHSAEAEALTAGIDTAYELARATPSNDIIARQWAIMKDPEGALYGGFVKRWKETGTISAVFRDEMSAQIDTGFDLILCLENAKRQAVQCTPRATP